MPTVRKAVVDIGTNSVKLLVADLVDDRVVPVVERSEQTRLGRGFYTNHELQPDAIHQTARAVACYVEHAATLGAGKPRIIATSAARDARNPDDLVRAVRNATGQEIEIIGGDTEARWSFEGVASQKNLPDTPLLIADVGGGSTEFIIATRREPRSHHSFALGTVRALEHVPPSDPPRDEDWERCRVWLARFMDSVVVPAMDPVWQSIGSTRPTLIATGGTAIIVTRIFMESDTTDARLIEAARLSNHDMHSLRRRLWGMPAAERRELRGLPASRADVILFGAAILEAIMDVIGIDEMRVSTRGLRHAALITARNPEPDADAGPGA